MWEGSDIHCSLYLSLLLYTYLAHSLSPPLSTSASFLSDVVHSRFITTALSNLIRDTPASWAASRSPDSINTKKSTPEYLQIERVIRIYSSYENDFICMRLYNYDVNGDIHKSKEGWWSVCDQGIREWRRGGREAQHLYVGKLQKQVW